jgi:hypothetical protein
MALIDENIPSEEILARKVYHCNNLDAYDELKRVETVRRLKAILTRKEFICPNSTVGSLPIQFNY